jgi:hypothetical protein
MATSRVETSHDLQEPDADGHFGLSFENSVSLRNRFHRLLTFFEALCDGLTVAVGVFAGYTLNTLMRRFGWWRAQWPGSM